MTYDAENNMVSMSSTSKHRRSKAVFINQDKNL